MPASNSFWVVTGLRSKITALKSSNASKFTVSMSPQ